MKPLLINGEWRSAATSIENINPSDTSDIVDIYAQAGLLEAKDAIEAAKQAAPKWAASTPLQRHDLLERVGQEILERKVEIGTLLSREEGKPLAEGIAETARAGQIFSFFAGEALRQTGDRLASLRPGVDIDVTREPVGVVGIIAPWNFPIAIPAWKIAPALCYGNAVVMKPAELVPGCSWVLADIIHRAGAPAGVFNYIYGPGSIVGQAILDSPDVDAISFTGSQNTGQLIASSCAKHMRKMQLEMGGKNPLVILDDADLDNAVECAINGAFYSTGQRCTASSRLVVTEGIYGRFVEACVERLRNLTVGNALSEGTDIGPVVDQIQLDQDVRFIDIARQEGGNIRIGGEVVERQTKGFYFTPALITDTNMSMTINRDEVFGPVASVVRVRDYEEALSIANDTPFGLSSGICTQSLKHASHYKKNSKAGMVMVNLPTAGVDYHVPFGGTKGSSYGSREQGRYAVEFYTNIKTAYTAP